MSGENSFSGMIHVIYGSDGGIIKRGNEIWYQNNDQGSNGLKDNPEGSERFGRTLASGDFNRDGADDLAIGVPKEGFPHLTDAGMIHVIYGSDGIGLVKMDNQIWYQNNDQGSNGLKDPLESSDYFGNALTVGDFNKDGADDLAIGVPEEKISSPTINERDGMINVIYGSSFGLVKIAERVPDNQIWYQGFNGILDRYENVDLFGSALTAGDFNKDGADDLAIGVPREDILPPINDDNGMIHVIYGSDSGIIAINNQLWHQDS